MRSILTASAALLLVPMRSTVRSILRASAALLLAAVAVSNADALPKPLPSGLSLDDSAEGAARKLENGDQEWTVRRLSAVKPQELAGGLVRTGLLALLNRAGADHTLADQPGERNVEFVIMRSDRASGVLAFAKGKMEAAMVRYFVAVDGSVSGDRNPFDPARLAPVKGFIDGMERSCSLKSTDPGPNHFRFAGKCGAAHVYVEYVPEDDSFVILYFRSIDRSRGKDK